MSFWLHVLRTGVQAVVFLYTTIAKQATRFSDFVRTFQPVLFPKLIGFFNSLSEQIFPILNLCLNIDRWIELSAPNHVIRGLSTLNH